MIEWKAKKWEIGFLMDGKTSKGSVNAQNYKTLTLDGVIVAEFVNHDPEFDQVATFANVLYVIQIDNNGRPIQGE